MSDTTIIPNEYEEMIAHNNKVAEQVSVLMRALGDSPHEIAETLHQAGYKGYRRESGHCPIANYLKAQLPGEHIGVCGTYISVADHRIDTTDAAIVFISRFDRGAYPQLEIVNP